MNYFQLVPHEVSDLILAQLTTSDLINLIQCSKKCFAIGTPLIMKSGVLKPFLIDLMEGGGLWNYVGGHTRCLSFGKHWEFEASILQEGQSVSAPKPANDRTGRKFRSVLRRLYQGEPESKTKERIAIADWEKFRLEDCRIRVLRKFVDSLHLFPNITELCIHYRTCSNIEEKLWNAVINRVMQQPFWPRLNKLEVIVERKGSGHNAKEEVNQLRKMLQDADWDWLEQYYNEVHTKTAITALKLKIPGLPSPWNGIGVTPYYALLVRVPDLVELDIEISNYRYKDLKSFRYLEDAPVFERVKKVTTKGHHPLEYWDMRQMVHMFPNVEELEITEVNGTFAVFLADRNIMMSFSKLHKLKRAYLTWPSDIEIRGWTDMIPPEKLKQLVADWLDKGLEQLEEIKFKGCYMEALSTLKLPLWARCKIERTEDGKRTTHWDGEGDEENSVLNGD